MRGEKPLKIKLALLISLALIQIDAMAQDHSIGVKAGLLGIGVEYGYSFSERIAVRGLLFGSSYSFGANESDIDYDFELNWDSLSVAVDLHPFTGPFRLSAGLMKNDNRLDARSTPANDIEIGGTIYTPAEIGSLSGAIGFDGTAPFFGLGWDWSRSKHFGFSLDLGVVKQGSPTVSLRASGSLLGDPAFTADIDAEEAELRDALDNFDLAPFASVGWGFRF
jgi:hypothetical protein